MTLEEFLTKIDRNGPVPEFRPDLGPCWLWTGGTLTSGHGRLWLDGTSRTAQSVSYEHFVGPVPSGLEIDHLCRVRPCVNPTHLEPVTHKENMRRGVYGMKTHCRKGHPYSGDNLYLDPRGERQCKACRRVQFLAFHERKKNAASTD